MLIRGCITVVTVVAIHKKQSRIHVKTAAIIITEVPRMFPIFLKTEGVLDNNCILSSQEIKNAVSFKSLKPLAHCFTLSTEHP